MNGNYIRLNNGIEMPAEGFGVFQISDLTVCEQTVAEAIKAGYRLIDTASSYKNETAVGAAVRKSGLPRRDFFITSKAFVNEMGHEQTREAFHRSLDNLGLDYLDLYLIHMPLGDYYGSWRAMEELAVLREYGIVPQAWAPFAEGMNGMFSNPVLNDIARKHGKSAAQVILRWNIQRGAGVIPKSVHRDRMDENISIWDFRLSQEEMERIAALDLGHPQMLDPRKPSEVHRLYNYLENPVLTSLKD